MWKFKNVSTIPTLREIISGKLCNFIGMNYSNIKIHNRKILKFSHCEETTLHIIFKRGFSRRLTNKKWKEGEMIVSTYLKSKEERRKYYQTKVWTLKNFPLAIILKKNSVKSTFFLRTSCYELISRNNFQVRVNWFFSTLWQDILSLENMSYIFHVCKIWWGTQLIGRWKGTPYSFPV